MVHPAGIFFTAAALATVSNAVPTLYAANVGVRGRPGPPGRSARRFRQAAKAATIANDFGNAANNLGNGMNGVASAISTIRNRPGPADDPVGYRRSLKARRRELYVSHLVNREEAQHLEARGGRRKWFWKKKKGPKKNNTGLASMMQSDSFNLIKGKLFNQTPGQSAQPAPGAAAGSAPGPGAPAAPIEADPSQQPPPGPVARELEYEDLEARDFWDGVLNKLD